jgi:hypothetical protein
LLEQFLGLLAADQRLLDAAEDPKKEEQLRRKLAERKANRQPPRYEPVG